MRYRKTQKEYNSQDDILILPNIIIEINYGK